MELDRNRIKDIVYKIKNGQVSKYELKEALGGKKLDEIFESFAIDMLLETVIENGKIHNLLKTEDGDGLDILEGLLNNRVMGDLSDFYVIKSDYILNLSKEERTNMANSILGSGDQKGLSNVLQILWDQGIGTEASTTRISDNIQIIKFVVKSNELDKQKTIQQMYQHEGIDVASIFYNDDKDAFELILSGNNLYEYIQGNLELKESNNKENIFERAMEESLQFLTELYEYYSKNGQDTTKVKEIMARAKNYLIQLRKQEGQPDKQNSWVLEPDMKEKINGENIEIGKKYMNQGFKKDEPAFEMGMDEEIK